MASNFLVLGTLKFILQLEHSMQNIIQTLLNSEEETIIKTLEGLKSSDIHQLKDALVLLWQVHSDEDIKNKAFEHLSQILGDSEKNEIEETFSVFKSIIEFLPWMGEYKDLQEVNFSKFIKNKDQYEGLLASSSVLVDSYLDLGRKLYMMFELADQAQTCFEGIVQYNRNNDEALYALGRLAERNEKMDEALDFYQRCIAINEEHVYGSLQLGILKATILEDYEGAIEHYNKVIEIEPFMGETHVRIAEAHYALGDAKRAKQFIAIALDINEYNEQALDLLGHIQWHYEEEIEEAMETFEKGLDHKIHGDSALLLASLGELHSAHLGEYDKARVYYEKSLKANVAQPDTLRKLIVILENIYQDYGAISTCYENYFRVEKYDAEMYVDYANFLIKYMHDYEFAQMQLNEAFQIDAENDNALKVERQITESMGGSEDENIYDTDDDNDNDDDGDDDDDDFEGGGAAGDN